MRGGARSERTRDTPFEFGSEMNSSRLMGSTCTSGGIEIGRMSVTALRCRQHNRHLSLLVPNGPLDPLPGLTSTLHSKSFGNPDLL
jgi:hypothetical protein